MAKDKIIKHPRLSAAKDTIADVVTDPVGVAARGFRRNVIGGSGLAGEAAREIKARQRRMKQPAGKDD